MRKIAIVLLFAMVFGGLLCPIDAYSTDAPVILETDYSNPAFDTSSVGWASDICGGRTFLENRTPLFEWTPVFGDEFDQALVGFSGTLVEDPSYSDLDLPFTHPFGFDWECHVAPDQAYASLLAPSSGCTSFDATTDPPVCTNTAWTGKIDDEVKGGVANAYKNNIPLPISSLGVKGVLGFELDQGLVPERFRKNAKAGDRVAMFGRWIVDCGHPDFHTEMHPPLLMAFGHQQTGSAGQPQTFSEVISRPYLVSQTFEDGLGVRHHLYNELLKGMAVPDCSPISNIVGAKGALDESGGCRDDVCECIPYVGCECVPLFCAELPRWFTLPCTTRFEAHQGFLPKPFKGAQTMSYIVRPPVARQCAARNLLVSAHFTVRHGVTASIEPYTNDAARVTITMDDSQYTQAPLPPKTDLSMSLDDIRCMHSSVADTIVSVRDGLLGLSDTLALLGLDIDPIGPLFALILERGLLTDCYDPSYGTLGVYSADHPTCGSKFPDCGALTPLTASSPMDTVNGVVAKPIDQLSGLLISAEDNSDGQPFPIYGNAQVEWSQEKFPPVITIIQPVAKQYLHTDVITLNYSVTETGCGVGTVTPSMDGMTTINNHGLASGQAIDLLTELAATSHTFRVDAADNVGDPSTASVTFTIIVTAQSIKDDVTQFLQRGAIKNAGLANALLGDLDAAAKQRAKGKCATAANIYQSFINKVQAQSGKGIDATAAQILIADAQYLITHCP